MAVLKAIHRFNVNSIKIPTQVFTDPEKTATLYGKQNKTTKQNKTKQNRIAKTLLNNKRPDGGLTIPDFKLHYRATVVKTV